MPDIDTFTLKDMVDFSSALRQMGSGATSMEGAADRIVHYLHEHLADKITGDKACVLVRLFKTHPYRDLDPKLQEFATKILGTPATSPEMKCLTLLATVGLQPEWNSREQSQGHKAIPLPSEHFIEAFPMVRQLVQQMGLEVNTILEPDPAVVVDMAQRTFNVFLIQEAVGSAYVPVQDAFVLPFGVRSVLGFGGILPSGNLFAVIMFSKVPIRSETADMFKTLALSVKVALLPFDGKVVFSPENPGNRSKEEG